MGLCTTVGTAKGSAAPAVSSHEVPAAAAAAAASTAPYCPFCVADMDEHPLGVEVGDLKVTGFVDAQSGGIAGHEQGAGEPTYPSYVVTNSHRLRHKPLREFTTEDLRFMLTQQNSLPVLIRRRFAAPGWFALAVSRAAPNSSAALVEDVGEHGSGVEIDTGVKCVRLVVQSHAHGLRGDGPS